jgi:AAA domain-containing protein
MSALPEGEHLVCIVRTEGKPSKTGAGGYQALTLEAISGQHKGYTHTDRLNLLHRDKRVELIAETRLADYCVAVGIHPQDFANVEGLMFKPFVVELRPQTKDPKYLEAKRLSAVSPAWKANAEALCAHRAAQAPAAPTASGSAPPSRGDALVIQTVAYVQAVRLRWLWAQRFALGKVSIIAGDPGLGKSQLTAFMAAVVTTGGDWPNGEGQAEQGDVVMLSCEDDLADTIRPRLEAAGADINRVHVVTAVTGDNGKRRSFNLSSDVAKLEAVLQQLQGRARLVFIDPVTAYMGRDVDSDKATEVRDVLNPVQDLAARYGVAVVCVSHPPKGAAGGKAVNAVIGSQAYVAATRATWIVTKDENDEERRLMLQVKNNLGNAKGLAFRVHTRDLPTGRAPYIAFEHGYVETTADEALSNKSEPTLGRSQMDKAKAFLQRELAAGPLDSQTLMRRAELMGVSERSLQRAAEKIGVMKRKDGFDGGWTWGFAMSPNAVDAMFAPLGLQPLDRC